MAVTELVREEAKGLAWLSVPITFAAALDLVPPVIVSMMIGKASGDQSEKVIAAGGLSDFFLNMVFLNVSTGLAMATTTMCSKAFGAKQYTQLWLYAQAGLLACVYIYVPIALIGVNGAGILKGLGQDQELTHIAGKFILIALASLPFSMAFGIARSALQAQNITIPFVLVSMAAYSISLPLGYVLGNHTSIGYIGVALTFLFTSVLQALASVPIVIKNKAFIDAWPGWQWRRANQLVGNLWSIGVGSVLMVTFQSAGFFITVLVCGYLPDPASSISASNIGSSYVALSYIPIFGISAAGVVRIGNAIGAGQVDRTAIATRLMFFTNLGASLVGVVLCWSFAETYVKGYTDDESTVQLATRLARHLIPLAPLVACLAAGQVLFQVCEAQALCAVLNCTCLVGIGVGTGLLFGFVAHGGVFGLWNGQLVGMGCVIVCSAIWYRRLDWQRQIDLAHERNNANKSGISELIPAVPYSPNSTGAESDSIVFMQHRCSSPGMEYHV